MQRYDLASKKQKNLFFFFRALVFSPYFMAKLGVLFEFTKFFNNNILQFARFMLL